MKIYCDYCGAQIDTDKYATCPNCGGTYSRDRELLDAKVRLDKMNDLDIEKKQLEVEKIKLENEKLRRDGKVGKATKGCLMPIVGFLCCLGILFIIIMIIAMTRPDNDEKKPEETTARSRISVSYSVSMEPVEIPDMPEIPDISIPEFEVTSISVPVVTVPEISVPEIYTE